MGEHLPSALEQELLGIKNLLWGRNIKAEIFKRWSQGLYTDTHFIILNKYVSYLTYLIKLRFTFG